jgi:hypothetical protein
LCAAEATPLERIIDVNPQEALPGVVRDDASLDRVSEVQSP